MNVVLDHIIWACYAGKSIFLDQFPCIFPDYSWQHEDLGLNVDSRREIIITIIGSSSQLDTVVISVTVGFNFSFPKCMYIFFSTSWIAVNNFIFSFNFFFSWKKEANYLWNQMVTLLTVIWAFVLFNAVLVAG